MDFVVIELSVVVFVNSHGIGITIAISIEHHNRRVFHNKRGHVHLSVCRIHAFAHRDHAHRVVAPGCAAAGIAGRGHVWLFGRRLHVFGEVGDAYILICEFLHFVLISCPVVVFVDDADAHIALTVVDKQGAVSVHRAHGCVCHRAVVGGNGFYLFNLHFVVTEEAVLLLLGLRRRLGLGFGLGFGLRFRFGLGCRLFLLLLFRFFGYNFLLVDYRLIVRLLFGRYFYFFAQRRRCHGSRAAEGCASNGGGGHLYLFALVVLVGVGRLGSICIHCAGVVVGKHNI